MKISELASATDVGVPTLKYYLREGCSTRARCARAPRRATTTAMSSACVSSGRSPGWVVCRSQRSGACSRSSRTRVSARPTSWLLPPRRCTSPSPLQRRAETPPPASLSTTSAGTSTPTTPPSPRSTRRGRRARTRGSVSTPPACGGTRRRCTTSPRPTSRASPPTRPGQSARSSSAPSSPTRCSSPSPPRPAGRRRAGRRDQPAADGVAATALVEGPLVGHNGRACDFGRRRTHARVAERQTRCLQVAVSLWAWGSNPLSHHGCFTKVQHLSSRNPDQAAAWSGFRRSDALRPLR